MPTLGVPLNPVLASGRRSPPQGHGTDAVNAHPRGRFRDRVPVLIAAAAVLGPFAVLLAVLAEHGTGFPVQDDWNVYLTSFDWLIRGDLSVLWASVSEHRVVISRILHFLEYAVVGDSRALLFFSPGLQLIFAGFALKRLSVDHPFSTGVRGAVLRCGTWFALSALLFSPIQAWAFARTAYLEIFALNLGALVFFLGLTRWHLPWALAGLILAVCSTPGWLALIPTAIAFFAYSALVASDSPPLRRQLRVAIPLLLISALVAAVYLLPFDHPNNSGDGHRPLHLLVEYLFLNPVHVLGQYVAFLGFPVSVLGLAGPVSDAVAPEDILTSSRIFGLLYLAFAGTLLGMRWYSRRSLDWASCYVLFTLALSFAIALARTPILGQSAVVNYAYSAYVVPGWAVALYLLVRSFDFAAGSRKAEVRNIVLAGSMALVLVTSSYQRGRLPLLGTLNGQKYLQSLYVESFLSPASAEAMWETARILDHPDPERVFEGTAILKEHDLVPRNWSR